MISPTQRPISDNTQHSLETSSTGFEPAIPATELPQTRALDSAVPRNGSEVLAGNVINLGKHT